MGDQAERGRREAAIAALLQRPRTTHPRSVARARRRGSSPIPTDAPAARNPCTRSVASRADSASWRTRARPPTASGAACGRSAPPHSGHATTTRAARPSHAPTIASSSVSPPPRPPSRSRAAASAAGVRSSGSAEPKSDAGRSMRSASSTAITCSASDRPPCRGSAPRGCGSAPSRRSPAGAVCGPALCRRS